MSVHKVPRCHGHNANVSPSTTGVDERLFLFLAKIRIAEIQWWIRYYLIKRLDQE
jgi:hypothetical protein